MTYLWIKTWSLTWVISRMFCFHCEQCFTRDAFMSLISFSSPGPHLLLVLVQRLYAWHHEDLPLHRSVVEYLAETLDRVVFLNDTVKKGWDAVHKYMLPFEAKVVNWYIERQFKFKLNTCYFHLMAFRTASFQENGKAQKPKNVSSLHSVSVNLLTISVLLTFRKKMMCITSSRVIAWNVPVSSCGNMRCDISTVRVNVVFPVCLCFKRV